MSMGDRYFRCRDGNGAVLPDFAARVDAPEGILAEELGITPAQALRVLNWHEREVAAAKRSVLVDALARVVAELIAPQKNLQVVIWGLAFSCGLAVARNGVSTMAKEADRLGLHRATLSFWKRHWDRRFADYGRVYGKSPETCERLRQARLRYLSTRKSNS